MPALPSIADLLKAGWKHERGMFVSPRTGALLDPISARLARQWHEAIAVKTKEHLAKPQEVETPANHYK